MRRRHASRLDEVFRPPPAALSAAAAAAPAAAAARGAAAGAAKPAGGARVGAAGGGAGEPTGGGAAAGGRVFAIYDTDDAMGALVEAVKHSPWRLGKLTKPQAKKVQGDISAMKNHVACAWG